MMMTTIITTERLELRRFCQVDCEPYGKIMIQPAVTKYLGDGKGMDEASAKKLVTFYSFSRGIFAVIEKATGHLIGHCGIRPIPDGRIELLYAYDPSVWGKGYGTEAGKAVLEYGKEHFEIDEIIAMAYPENPASIGIMKKLGFEHLGQEEHFGNVLEVYRLNMREN